MSFPEHFRYDHEAMATVFSLLIIHEDETFARQVSVEAFREVDRLEAELSRFVESSSITRLNRAQPYVETPIGADTYLCLKQGLIIEAATGGAFDMGYSSRIMSGCLEYQPAVELSLDGVSAWTTRPDPQLDLGGIGKGYAVDCLKSLLESWEIESALIMGGRSTLLALGNPPGRYGWPVNLWGGSRQAYELSAGYAVSASGFSVQEDHVRDPSSGEKAAGFLRAWAIAGSGALADGLSTAILSMRFEEVEALMEVDPTCRAILESASGSYHSVG